MRKAFGLVAGTLLIWSGTAQAQADDPVATPPAQADDPVATPPAPAKLCDTLGETTTWDARRLSEVIAVHDCWSADTTNNSQVFLNDLYSRWIVEEVPQRRGDLARDYKAERINPLARLFVGKTRGAVMSVKIRMRDPDIDFTVPLLALDYSGKLSEGQNFATTFTSSDMSLPDFRLNPNTSVAVEGSARVTKNVDVQATGVVIGALRDALTIVSPGGSLLTSINREQVQRVSGAYDNLLSKLLSSTVGESASVGRVTSEWYAKAAIYVSIDVPDEVRTMERPRKSTSPRRIWFRIGMACPRLSIFDTANVCSDQLQDVIRNPYRGDAPVTRGRDTVMPGADNAQYQRFVKDLAYRVSPNQVLGFRVGPQRTVRQYLTEQEWFISLSKKIVTPTDDVADAAQKLDAQPETDDRSTVAKRLALKAKLDTAGAAAAEFCDAVVDKLYMAGLSRLDAQIGLWAVATGIPDFYASRQIFQESDGCKADLPAKGTGRWAFAVDQRRETPTAH